VNHQIFIRQFLFIHIVVTEVNPFSDNKLIMILVLNVFSNIFHHWVAVVFFVFWNVDSSHWLYLDNLFTMILPLLIVKCTYNFSDTWIRVPIWNVIISNFKPRIVHLISEYISRSKLLSILNLSLSEFIKLKYLLLKFFLFIICLLLESSFIHFNSNNQRYQLSRTTNLPLVN